jgi:hypothetical protein
MLYAAMNKMPAMKCVRLIKVHLQEGQLLRD